MYYKSFDSRITLAVVVSLLAVNWLAVGLEYFTSTVEDHSVTDLVGAAILVLLVTVGLLVPLIRFLFNRFIAPVFDWPQLNFSHAVIVVGGIEASLAVGAIASSFL